MDPVSPRQVERLIGIVERLLDRGFLEEHERVKTELIVVRNDVNRFIERAERLEDANETTGSIYVTELREKLKSREESGDKWVRYVVATAVALLFTSGSALLGYIAAHH